MGERYLRSVRLLAECLQGFERLSASSVRQFGLTHAQFDIIATLGNTDGMSYKELGDKTLITKGTLTGVVERLEEKGLVARTRNGCDKRSFHVRLTCAGVAMFELTFPVVVALGKEVFSSFEETDFDAAEATLRKMKRVISDYTVCPNSPQQKETD